ncbi:DUF7677 family protein [Polaribacter septentrionalilitoris]|uniref:DUF7677 family protein n=1 Tax=Polaribacter septentrionalilitoris TaxID=2494657 RepID=UPI001356EDB8|nr:hypothetical protein [Polaribacter septentrionalilitoris]
MKLSQSYRSALRFFIYYYFNNTLGFKSGISKLTELDYVKEMNEMPSNLETMFAIFSNNIEMDATGKVLNFDYSIKRASQFVTTCLYDEDIYVVEPSFEEWEIELH